MWITTLEENGIAVLPVDSEHVRLTDDDHSAVFFVLTVPRVARTHDVNPAPERHALLVARSITSEALERASAAGWSVVTDDGAGRLRLGQRTVRLDSTIPTQLPPRPRGRPGRSVFSRWRTEHDRTRLPSSPTSVRPRSRRRSTGSPSETW